MNGNEVKLYMTHGKATAQKISPQSRRIRELDIKRRWSTDCVKRDCDIGGIMIPKGYWL